MLEFTEEQCIILKHNPQKWLAWLGALLRVSKHVD